MKADFEERGKARTRVGGSEDGASSAPGRHRIRGRISHQEGGTEKGVPARRSAGGICESVGRTGMGGTAHQEAVPRIMEDSAPAEDVTGGLSDEAIRTLYRVWGSKNKIAAMLTGTKAKRQERIDQALRSEVNKDSV
jgi:hypothetical protein